MPGSDLGGDAPPPHAVPPELTAWCRRHGRRAEPARTLSGGAVSTVVRLSGDAVPPAVAKFRRDAPAGLFAAEADGLRQLDATRTVTVPDVLAVGDRYLVLQDLGTSDPQRLDWSRLAGQVAALHHVTGPAFGADADNFLGLLPQRNPWTADGHEFFARHRLLRWIDEPPAAALTTEDRRRLDRLAERLPRLIPVQAPVLLHGDLWSGNIVGGADRVAVIDPAPYFGWPEAELSMLWCAGHADPRFFDAYIEQHPLQPGWQDRMPLLHLREHLSVLAHFGARSGALDPIRDTLMRFVG